MPPKPKPIPRQPNASQSQSVSLGTSISSIPLEALGSEVQLGSIKVGRNGIIPLDESIPPPNVNLDDLVNCGELGAGAHGSVSLYRHKTTKEKYAVKKINVSSKSQAMSMVAAEIRNIFVEDSQYSVKLHNGFLREGFLYLIMDYMNGGNLEELLKIRPKMPPHLAAYLAKQVLSALNQLHTKHRVVDAQKEKRQIHRDIKPANIMLSKQGDIKIADFGVAGSADTIGLASFVGTATYMSPERIKGQVYGTPSDVWSLGIVIAEVLRGKYPFESAGTGFMQLLKQVTSGARVIIEEDADAQNFVDLCLQQDSTQRPSAGQLLEHPWIVQHGATDGTKENFSTWVQVVKGSNSTQLESNPATPLNPPSEGSAAEGANSGSPTSQEAQ